METEVRPDDVARFAAAFDAEPRNLLALNAVTKSGIAAVALNRGVVSRVDHTYSHRIETPEATNQESSGRCWLFAGLNALRLAAMEKMKLEKLELSQNYPMFWDKLEKANHFLESIIATCDEPLDGRLVMWLLANVVPDGGQWDMFVNLMTKYGVVPKSMMPETHSSSKSAPMNALLVARLREDAAALRQMHAAGAGPQELRSAKGGMMADVYRMLCIHLGRPPERFLWEWRDKDKQFHRRGEITPRQFLEEFVGLDLDEMVCLIHAPTADKPYGKLYTVAYLGNVVGGRIVRYLNVEMPALKKAAVDMITGGHAVWFGCDVGKMLERDLGVLDVDLYDYELVYGTDFKLDKAGRLNYGHSRMTHAMVLTGADLDDDGTPLKWRVENSWGDKHGDKGSMLMSDRWFDEFLYEVTVRKDLLSAELLEALDTEPVVLPPWDPMGALALAT
jgi:bleomycin hydrolase